MPTSCVIGLLWGDEGKGKVIDHLAGAADYVVRYAGGHNAGHTIRVRGQRLVLHLIPSGAMWPDVVNVIANGVVVDPWHLEQEIEGLRRFGASLRLGENLLVSERAHVILPVHRALDRVAEQIRGTGRIGTTGRGIGPAYADRASRAGVRMGDLLRPAQLRAALERTVAEKAPLLRAFSLEVPDVAGMAAELIELGQRLAPAIGDTGHALRTAHAAGKRLLLEGAQGALLDVDHGTYPYCTSSSSAAGGCVVGTGLPPSAVGHVTGVAKAYATRVGEGPFPTELHGELAAALREAGHEYGATTGRPRRIGWFDTVALRYALALSGTTSIVLTSLDVLRGFAPLRIAIGYEGADGRRVAHMPAFDLAEMQPVYEDMVGFDEDITGVRRWQDLPGPARAYVESVERHLAVRVAMISVGPERDQVVLR